MLGMRLGIYDDIYEQEYMLWGNLWGKISEP